MAIVTQRRFTFDLDGTLCTNEHGKYALARPFAARIAKVRELFESGGHITIDSSRGYSTGHDWQEGTAIQLAQWGVPYHELRTGLKPLAHVYVGDEAINADDFFTDEATIDRWPDEYYCGRELNDPRRLQSFNDEERFLIRHGLSWGLPGTVCDVGCSTGEFLEAICWTGPRYGMEISAHARRAAMQRGVDFSRNILTERNFFDVVIFRGTIQHLPEPFRAMQQAHRALKPGGHIAFLATPNAGSLVYRLWQELPVSDDARNFWMPSAKTLSNALKNFGFEIVATEYPYLNSGYARPLLDMRSFVLRFFGGKTDFAFPGNMFNMVALKP